MQTYFLASQPGIQVQASACAEHGLALQGVGDAASNESSRVCPPYAKGGVDEARAVAVPCNM